MPAIRKRREHPLARYRRKHKLTYPKLAAYIGDGCSIEAVRSWCQGRRRMKANHRERVAALTGIAIKQLERRANPR